MKPVNWAPDAGLELIEAAGWYESKQQGLGEEFIAEVDAVVGAVAEVPLSFPRWPKRRDYRRAIVPRFPYVVFFIDHDDHVLIYALAHTRRRPGYWLRRTAGKEST